MFAQPLASWRAHINFVHPAAPTVGRVLTFIPSVAARAVVVIPATSARYQWWSALTLVGAPGLLSSGVVNGFLVLAYDHTSCAPFCLSPACSVVSAHDQRPLLTRNTTHVGTRPTRMRDWRFIQALGRFAPRRRRRRALQRGSRAKSSRVAEYVAAGISAGSLSSIASWLRKFLDYVCKRAWSRGRIGPSRRMFNDNDVALGFLAHVADEQRGRTRVGAAVRAIDFARRLIGVTPLGDDPRTPMLKQGVLRCFPHKPQGAVPLPAFMLIAIVSAWGSHKTWWRRMTAVILMVAFRALLRAAGVLSIPLKGVAWVTGFNEQLDPPVIPARHSGALVLVPARKTRQSRPSWVPLRNRRATRLLARWLYWRRKRVPRNAFLFPSRAPKFRRSTRVWVPNSHNRLSTKTLLSLFRRALREVCGLTKTQAARFSLHSLRVGGINYLRQAGVEIGMRAQVATHKSLLTS